MFRMEQDVMKDTLDDIGGVAGTQAEPPAWLTGLIARTQLPGDFDRRCDIASKAAYAIFQLRVEGTRHKISDAPFGRVVQALAVIGKIHLGDLQESLSVPDWDKVSAATAAPFARLARLLEFSYEQAERAIRGTFAEPVLAQVAPAGGVPMSFDQALQKAESQYSEEDKAELDRLIQAIRSEYEMG
jgi:hypothetical protein